MLVAKAEQTICQQLNCVPQPGATAYAVLEKNCCVKTETAVDITVQQKDCCKVAYFCLDLSTLKLSGFYELHIFVKAKGKAPRLCYSSDLTVLTYAC